MSAAQNAPGKPASGTPAAAAFATLFLLLPAGWCWAPPSCCRSRACSA